MEGMRKLAASLSTKVAPPAELDQAKAEITEILGSAHATDPGIDLGPLERRSNAHQFLSRHFST